MKSKEGLSYSGSANIIDLETFERLRDTIPGVIAFTSGGYDPIHTGHISLLTDTKRYLRAHHEVPDDVNITLVVAVNDDDFLARKKGKHFIDHDTRSQIVAGIRDVDYVIPFRPTKHIDNTVSEVIHRIRPKFFVKGGDRSSAGSVPERDACLDTNCILVLGVGADKNWSSSDFLREWQAFLMRKIFD